jgi:rfaE bifunctional protein nucleotidyltransferase chain/domain
MNLEEVKNFMDKYRASYPNRKVATTNGCFDVLHYGHLKGFELAKQNADILLVGINSDDYIKQFKGRTPVHNEIQRAYNLGKLRDVNGVVLFTQDTPEQFLRAVKPNLHLKSKAGYKGIEGEILKEWNGELILMDDLPGFSSSRLIASDKDVYRMCFDDESG